MSGTQAHIGAVLAASSIAVADQFFITQSVVPDFVISGNAACSADGHFTTIDTSWWRSFDLAAVNAGNDIRVTGLQLGVEESSDFYGGNTTQPIVNVNLYQDPTGGSILTDELELLGTMSIIIPFGTAFFIDAAADIAVPGGIDLAVEVHTPDFEPHDLGFWLGSNPFGQTGPSYFSSFACGIEEPVDLVDLGYPTVCVLIHVEACPAEECQADCNLDGQINILDFLCFFEKMFLQDPSADCDEDDSLDVFDWLCFQGLVTEGCG